jgi:2-amino-4-hydroxy-6-hydroxymethyldihydropteridine diphosphokinase
MHIPKMKNATLLLGSNLEPRVGKLYEAVYYIRLQAGEVVKASSVYESEPWGFDSQHPFLNQALIIETRLSPLSLLEALQHIEKQLGRTPEKVANGYADRVIDLDILFYDDQIVKTDELTIPHKFLQERRFTLVPLAEIAADKIHPVFNKTIRQLLDACPDASKVYPLWD